MQKDTRLWRVICQYLSDMEERNLVSEYIYNSRIVLRRFADHCLENRIQSASKVKAEHLRSFLQTFAHMSMARQRFVYAVVRQFLMFVENPLVLKFRYRPKGRDRIVTWLSPEETQTVLANRSMLRPREAMMVVGGLLEGLRRVEIRAMRIADLRMALKDGHWLSVRGKMRPRTIPLHPVYAQIISRYLGSVDLSDSSLAIPMSNSRYASLMTETSKAIGIHFSAHVLRRSFARNLRLKGVKLEVIAAWLGHQNIAMTERYVGVMGSDLQESMQFLDVPKAVQPIAEPAIVK